MSLESSPLLNLNMNPLNPSHLFPVPPPSPPPPDPIPPPESPARRMVRMNALRTARNVRFTYFSFFIRFIFYTPQIIAIIYYGTKNLNSVGCDKPLLFWCVIYGIRSFLVLLLSFLSVLFVSFDPLDNLYGRMNDSLNLIGFGWFLTGNLWILNAESCEKIPEIYTLSVVLLSLNYFVLFLPCLLLICLAPLVFFCLPLLIRLGVLLQDDFNQIHGATDNEIANIPEFVYHANNNNNNNNNSLKFDDDEKECSICLSPYEDGDLIRQLPCHTKHKFHSKCIADWLKLKKNCAICRAPIGSLNNRSNNNNNSNSNYRSINSESSDEENPLFRQRSQDFEVLRSIHLQR